MADQTIKTLQRAKPLSEVVAGDQLEINGTLVTMTQDARKRTMYLVELHAGDRTWLAVDQVVVVRGHPRR